MSLCLNSKCVKGQMMEGLEGLELGKVALEEKLGRSPCLGVGGLQSQIPSTYWLLKSAKILIAPNVCLLQSFFA